MFENFLKNQRALITAGKISFALFVILAIVALFDQTEILGVNRWIKPLKFTISPAIYMWTLAVYLYFVKDFALQKKVIAWGVILTMAGEIFLITMQAARGTTSHFNVAQPFDGLVFTTMGILIVANTILVFHLLWIFFRAGINLPPSIIWGMRFGIMLFILAAFEGGVMSVLMRHSVGVADGGAGLPFVNWLTRGGDLRVAHFVGMHALQIIPLFAYFLEKKHFSETTKITIAFSFVYFCFFAFVFLQAIFGQPLFPGF